ncbi:MAG: glucose-6-phosphate isomerase [Gammaproteobacteria bacterium]|nr:glucose-6-phosphate isomerase [Gammaproteobacteria bacterium]
MALVIRTDNMYSDAVGDQGVHPARIETLAPRLKTVHARVAEDLVQGLAGTYGCLTLSATMVPELERIHETAAAIRATCQDLVVVGIGGSSLGTKAIWHALHETLPAGPRLHFVENVDPYDLKLLLARLTPEDTALICISKSGGTLETVVQFLVLRDWLITHLGTERARRRQWIVTDPEQGWLRALAREEGIPSLPVPPSVGGRYSVLSPVGLLPLAAAGVDIDTLLAGGRELACVCQDGHFDANPALEMAALYYLLDTEQDKRISVMMPYVNRLRLFVDWYCQLWAESLGKERAGTTPAGSLPVRAMGAVDQHSQLQMYLESRNDKMFTFVELTHWEDDAIIPLGAADRDHYPHLRHKTIADIIDAEFQATREAITDARHPNLTIEIPGVNAFVLGSLIELYQRVTVYTGLLYGINPLDQPSVEKGKRIAIRYLQTRKRLTHLSDIRP